ncbi:MAG: hypothetical protein KJ600_01065 [Nanoarchaeota archaeon]|nr:hypothetical protein [Nanoarchaeota archaeon]MBU1103132.1 hypothetical protein [Nanoarchaeota archaeon]
MKKVKKVKAIKSKVRIVREIKKGRDGREEIEELTSDEIGLSQGEVERVVEPVRGDGRRVFSAAPVDVPAPTAAPESGETSGVALYDTGRGLGDEREGRRIYMAERMQSGQGGVVDNRNLSIGGEQFLPENVEIQRTESAGQGERIRAKYESGGKEKKKSVGPWN